MAILVRLSAKVKRTCVLVNGLKMQITMTENGSSMNPEKVPENGIDLKQ